MAENNTSKATRFIGIYETTQASIQKQKGEIGSHLHALNSKIVQLQVTLNELLDKEGNYKKRFQMLCDLETEVKASQKNHAKEMAGFDQRLEALASSDDDVISASEDAREPTSGSLDQPALAGGSEGPASANPSGVPSVAGSSNEPSKTSIGKKRRFCHVCKSVHKGICKSMVKSQSNRKRIINELLSSDDEETTHSDQSLGIKAMSRRPTVLNGWPASRIKKHLLDPLTKDAYDDLVNRARGINGPKAFVQLERLSDSDGDMALALRTLELEKRKKFRIPKKANLQQDTQKQSK